LVPLHPILAHQNDPALVRLLQASTVAYTRAKSWEIAITYFLIALAILYPITYVITKNNDVRIALLMCSFALTIIVQIFMDTFKGNTSKGALFKEEFDIALFRLPWKSTLKKPDDAEISELASDYKGTEIRDWYSPNLSGNIPTHIAIAVLQHLNTSWDIILRRNYKALLIWFISLYSVSLALLLLLYWPGWLTAFLLMFSVLSFYTHFISLIRAHNGVIKRREAISKHLDEIIQEKRDISIAELRDIQDEIYITRQEATKVPNFYFRWYQKAMNDRAEKYIESVNRSFDP
jgi:hypothetical protein